MPDHKLCVCLAAAVEQAFRTKEIVMVLWSLATSGVHDDPLFVIAPPLLMQRLQQRDMSTQVGTAQPPWPLSSMLARRLTSMLPGARD